MSSSPARIKKSLVLFSILVVLPIDKLHGKFLEKIKNKEELNHYTIEPLPDWSSKFKAKGEQRFFKITSMMEDFGLTRLQATELRG